MTRSLPSLFFTLKIFTFGLPAIHFYTPLSPQQIFFEKEYYTGPKALQLLLGQISPQENSNFLLDELQYQGLKVLSSIPPLFQTNLPKVSNILPRTGQFGYLLHSDKLVDWKQPPSSTRLCGSHRCMESVPKWFPREETFPLRHMFFKFNIFSYITINNMLLKDIAAYICSFSPT